MERSVATKLATLLALVAVGAGSFVVVQRARADDRGRLTTVQELPDDVVFELDRTWIRFNERFAGRRTCFGDATLLLVEHVEGGDARYVVADARIEVEIPTTPERFRESVVHELAHHVEHTCAEFADLRAALHPVFGADRSWFDGPTWEETPSEIWAETVVALVLDGRIRHADEIDIDPRSQALVGAWSQGRWPAE